MTEAGEMRDGTPILELRDFRYTYLEGTPRANEAIRGVSFGVSRGERVAIVGPTQSGKSTVVDSFAHLLRLKPGQVFYEGEDVAAPGYDRGRLRREVGIVFQQPDAQIIEDVVGADVAFGPTAAGMTAEETRQRVEESLDGVGLRYPDFRLRYVHALSGGQRRRVAIAGVLAMRTPVLVLDEPMAGLDPQGARRAARRSCAASPTTASSRSSFAPPPWATRASCATGSWCSTRAASSRTVHCGRFCARRTGWRSSTSRSPSRPPAPGSSKSSSPTCRRTC